MNEPRQPLEDEPPRIEPVAYRPMAGSASAPRRGLRFAALALIGAGGIAGAEDAWQKLRAGASLLQLYSALVYQGPQLIADILQGLLDRLDDDEVIRDEDNWKKAIGS